MTTTQSVTGLRPIRSPRGIPILGHTPQIPDINPVAYFGELAGQFPRASSAWTSPARRTSSSTTLAW